MTQFKKGDIIVVGEYKRKVMEVLGDLVFISQNDHTRSSGFNTHQELIDNGWKLEEKEWTPEINEEYFYPDFIECKYDWDTWVNDTNDNIRKNTVGIFKTPEEAIARYEEMIKLILN